MDLVTAFLDGARWARQRSLAADADGEHWITVNGGSKTGGKGGGSHVKLDGEGRIVAGMGGKFSGRILRAAAPSWTTRSRTKCRST